MSVLTALILVPDRLRHPCGFGRDLGPMMLDGVKALAPTAVMLLFAILFFSIMIDVGLFEPVVGASCNWYRATRSRYVVGTSSHAARLARWGWIDDLSDRTAALLPLYERLGLSRLMLASVIMQAGGVMNILPWGGPTARAASALRIDAGEIFLPMIPADDRRSGVGDLRRLCVRQARAHACRRAGLGSDAPRRRDVRGRSRWRRGGGVAPASPPRVQCRADARAPRVARGRLLPLPVLFMVAYAVALVVNYPSLDEQKGAPRDHAANALAVASVICAAGILTGIMSGTK